MEENRIPERALYMILGTTRLRGRPRNRRQDGVREDGRIVGGEGWQEKLHNREEWKKLLRMARNANGMNEWRECIILCIDTVILYLFLSFCPLQSLCETRRWLMQVNS